MSTKILVNEWQLKLLDEFGYSQEFNIALLTNTAAAFFEGFKGDSDKACRFLDAIITLLRGMSFDLRDEGRKAKKSVDLRGMKEAKKNE